MKRGIPATVFFVSLIFPGIHVFSQGHPYQRFADKSIFAETMVEMSWPGIKQEAAQHSLVLFPVAVVEEHGPHLDLSPDIYLTVIYCRMIKRGLEAKGIHAIIAPPYYWGINGTKAFPGSFTVRPSTMKALLFDALKSMKGWGFHTVMYVNLHGDGEHRRTLAESVEELRDSLEMDVYDLSSLEVTVSSPSFPPERGGKFHPDYHAGANETADIHAFFPEKVRTGIVKTLRPQSTFEPLGYVGDPANFQREKGGLILALSAQYDAEKIAAFLQK